MSADILVVDDEADIRDLVAGILEDEGHRTRTAGSSDEALASIEARRPHLVFLDIWLQGSRLDGLQVLELIKAEHPDLPVVMISGHGNVETAVSAIKSGAYDFIEKPFKADRLVLVAERALEASRLKREVRDLRVPFDPGDAHRRQVGHHQPAAAGGGAGVADQCADTRDRRARFRQGTDRANHSRPVRPRERAVRGRVGSDDHA